jgi:hypothetical protein
MCGFTKAVEGISFCAVLATSNRDVLKTPRELDEFHWEMDCMTKGEKEKKEKEKRK